MLNISLFSIRLQTAQAFSCLALALCSAFSLPLQAKQHERSVRQYDILPNAENVSARFDAMLRQLKAEIPQGDTLRLLFDKGTYHFGEAGAAERRVYISNHDQVGNRRIGCLIEEFDHLHLVAPKGCTWLFHDRMLPVAIIRSKDVRLEGMAIDFTETQITQAAIVRNEGEGGIVFRPAPWAKWRINAKGQFEAYGSNWKNTPHWGIVFRASDGQTAYRISDIGYNTTGVRQLPDGTLQAPLWKDKRLKEGMVVAMRSYERPNPGVFIDGSEAVHCEKVTVHYADGMGFLTQNSHDITLSSCAVRRSKTKRGEPIKYYTTQADATHFSGCSGHIRVVKGLFEGMMDDAINVHGVYLQLANRLDDHTVEARYMHSQAYGFEWGKIGDTVQFVYSRTFDTLPTRFVLSEITPVDQPQGKGTKVFRLRFAEALPEEVQPSVGFGLENMRKCPSVDFSYNTIRYNRARGALFNTPKHVHVSHNRFQYISGAAIVSSTDCNQWFESGQTQDMHIHHNLFEDVLTSLYQFTEAVITLHPVIPGLKEQKTPFYGRTPCGILIENNVFKTFDTPLLYAKSVKGLCWRNNKVKQTKTYPKFHWNQQTFHTIGSSDIEIEHPASGQ